MRMRFLILGLNYLPESTSTGPYTADLAEYLQRRGHDVQVVTGFPAAPQYRIWKGYEGRRFQREEINGVPVLRTYLYASRQPARTFSRILFDTSFTVSSLIGGLTAGPCDAVVAVSPPLQLGVTAWMLASLRRARFFFHIKDLVPDAAVATGMLDEKSLSVRAAHALERFIYRRAEGIGVICEGFRRNLMAKGVPEDRISLLPDYVDLDFIRPLDRVNSFRERHGIAPETFLVMYSGSIGRKQGLQTFVEAAAEFGDDPNVRFYLVAEGPYLSDLKARAEQLRLWNLTFLPLQPRETLSAQLSAADLLVITQKRSVTDVVFPGKLLYYMASGRPILAAVTADSETGSFVNSQQVGVVVPPEEPGALADAVRFLKQNRHEAERLGRNGRRTVEEKFDRRVLLPDFAAKLEALAGSDKRSTGVPAKV